MWSGDMWRAVVVSAALGQVLVAATPLEPAPPTPPGEPWASGPGRAPDTPER
ncbi:hypothetical protein JYU34_006675 [Plutella xylostella]|uniref:Uncharacterized protein n=1 Tax=Plutella xylostella TaxID=51655 RepID=A0ABQ7QSJ6_PLUXY|nr:hypothetical protein JYU34_006675 [Plutella xylostella]